MVGRGGLEPNASCVSGIHRLERLTARAVLMIPITTNTFHLILDLCRVPEKELAAVGVLTVGQIATLG